MFSRDGMTAFYVYQLTPEQYTNFSDLFPDLAQRNEDFRVVTNTLHVWEDPPDLENRRRIILRPAEENVFILAKSGRGDWEFARWLATNEIPMPPPPHVYLW